MHNKLHGFLQWQFCAVMVYCDPFLHVYQMSKYGLLLSHRAAQQVPVHPRVLLQKGHIITKWWKKNECFLAEWMRSDHISPLQHSHLHIFHAAACSCWLWTPPDAPPSSTLSSLPLQSWQQWHHISLLLEVTLQRNSHWCTALTLITLPQKQLQNRDFLWLAKKPKLWSLALPVCQSEQNSTKLQRVFVFLYLSAAVKYSYSFIRYLMNKYIVTLAFTHQLC